MSSRYPPLNPSELRKIALGLGWQPHPHPPRSSGDHDHYLHPDIDLENIKAFPQYSPFQIDTGEDSFGPGAIKMAIKRLGVTREEFYGATKKTAKKIGVKYKKPSSTDS